MKELSQLEIEEFLTKHYPRFTHSVSDINTKFIKDNYLTFHCKSKSLDGTIMHEYDLCLDDNCYTDGKVIINHNGNLKTFILGRDI